MNHRIATGPNNHAPGSNPGSGTSGSPASTTLRPAAPVQARTNLGDWPSPSGVISTYVIVGEPYDGWAKIGKTESLQRDARVRALQTGNPRRLRVVGGWVGRDHEQFLHGFFAPLRGVGEWFALPPALLSALREFTPHENGHVGLVAAWTVARVREIADGETDPELLAQHFAASACVRRPRLLGLAR